MAVVSYLDWTKDYLCVVGCGDFADIPKPDTLSGDYIMWEASYGVGCAFHNTHKFWIDKKDKDHPAIKWLIAEGVLIYAFSAETRVHFDVKSINEREKNA